MKKLVVIFLMLFAASIAQADPDITTGLRIYCPMDDSAGYTIENKAGFGDPTIRRVDWNGTWQDDPVVATPAWEPTGGKFYGCLNGHNAANGGQPIWCQAIEAVAVGYDTRQTTTAFWFKMETTDTSVYAFNSYGAWGSRSVFTEFNSDNYIYGQSPSGGQQEKYGPGWQSLRGAWHHYAFVTDFDNAVPEDRLKMYVDGVLVGAGTSFPEPGWPLNISVLSFLGSPADWGASSEMRMDEFRFYHRNLSDADIAALYAYVPPAPGPGRAVINGPINNGKGSPGWRLSWMDGTSGPFSSYDVYLGTDMDDVKNATAVNQCTPGSSNLVGDIDNDCVVDEFDLIAMANCWMSASSCNTKANLYNADSIIDISDFAVMAPNWLVSRPFIANVASKEFALTSANLPRPGYTYYWRIDEHKGSDIIKGAVWNFTAVNPWKQTRYVNMMGWSETMQLDPSLRASYAQSLKDLGIRNTMDHELSIPYTNPLGLETFIYKNPTTGEYAIANINTAGNCGYFQYDEPSSSLFATTVKANHWACRDADQSRPSYTNLLSSQGIGGASGSGYLAYINAFITPVNPQILSFDCYPQRYGWQHHYWSLDVCRTRSLQLGIPLWNWQQTIQKTSSNPTSSARNQALLRNCLYSSLTYGVKGVSWFDITLVYTFGTQGYGSRTWAKKTSPTWAWSDLAAVNAEINRVGDIMINFTSQNVYHTNAVTGTTLPLLSSYPTFWIQIANSNSGFVLGTFKDPQGVDYAMVCNKENANGAAILNKQVSFNNTAVSAVYILNETNGTWSSLTLQGTSPNQFIQIPSLGSGYAKLLKIVKP